MLKRNITYVDFNDRTITETFYFNLSKPELIEMVNGDGDQLLDHIQRIVAAQNFAALLTEFKKLILLSYGEKSEDGKRFVKNDAIREAFSQTAAYQSLYMELCTSDEAAALFFNGILPADMTIETGPKVQIPTNVAPLSDFDKIRQAAATQTLPPPAPTA